jgi:Tfp pilus assembly protein PilF
MTVFEIIISLVVTLIAVMTFIDKLSNRQKQSKEAQCNDHALKLNDALRQLESLKATKADTLDLSNLKSDVSSLKADMGNVKEGVNRIENLLMERTL